MCVSALRLRFAQILSRLVVHTLNKFHEHFLLFVILLTNKQSNKPNKSSASLIQATTIATFVEKRQHPCMRWIYFVVYFVVEP